MATDRQIAYLRDLRTQISASPDNADRDHSLASAYVAAAIKQAKLTPEQVQLRQQLGHWRHDLRPYLVADEVDGRLPYEMTGSIAAMTAYLLDRRARITALTDTAINEMDGREISRWIDDAREVSNDLLSA